MKQLAVERRRRHEEDRRWIQQSIEESQAQLGQIIQAWSVAIEISRSGHGARAWTFFAGRMSVRDARRLGTSIISHACARARQLKLASYDRWFPYQGSRPQR